MNLSDFIRGYANASSDELIEEMFDWFYNSNSVKTENPNRITRKDYRSGCLLVHHFIIKFNKLNSIC